MGQEVEVEALESLGSKTHVFTTPGVAFWRISGWERAELTFRASSSETRIEFNTPTTTGLGSVGVLDAVTVTASPFVFLRNSSTGLILEYSGVLEECPDLKTWVRVEPQPLNIVQLSPISGAKFFRVAK